MYVNPVYAAFKSLSCPPNRLLYHSL